MDIICIAFTSWEGNYTKSTVELMKCMARRHRVMYVDYNHTYTDVLRGIFTKGSAPVKRILGFQKRLRKTQTNGDNLWLLTPPPVFPVNFIKNKKLYAFVQRINASIICRSVLKAGKKLNFDQPVVVNAWNPYVGVFLYGKLHEKITVYYCFDEIGESAWTKNHGSYMEKLFLRMVDACVVSSRGLLQTKSAMTKRCFIVQNGVDYELFRSGYSFPKEAPVIIGFVGTIAGRIDFSVLEAIAVNFPEARLVLVGRTAFDGRSVDEDVAGLKTYPNVIFEGAQPSEKLPDYLKKFHIGIIPNMKNAHTAAVYPMKINEYLAAGIPVVTSDFAPLDEFADMITVARSTSEFLQGIRTELATDNSQKQKDRQDAAQQNSWNNRALKFEKIIEDILAEQS